MSKSYKHTFITGNGSGSEKDDKRFTNRKLRRSVKHEILKGEEDIFPEKREISDIWSFSKDGKHYFGNLKEFLKSTKRFHDETYWIKVWRDLRNK